MTAAVASAGVCMHCSVYSRVRGVRGWCVRSGVFWAARGVVRCGVGVPSVSVSCPLSAQMAICARVGTRLQLQP
eukprot:2974959-Prymnesium_polylepis.1